VRDLEKYGRWGFKEVCKAGGPIRWVTGRHGPSSKTRTRQTGSQFARDLKKHRRWVSERVEMSADRLDRTRAVTTRLAKRDPKSSASTFAFVEINQFYGRLGGADCDRRLFDFNKTPLW